MDARDLEAHWQLALPPSFGRVLALHEPLVLGGCEFLEPGELVTDAERWAGMLPQFLPFAGWDEGLYGFYAASDSLHVLAWDEDADCYRPVASSFDAFVARLMLEARYEMADDYGDDDPMEAEQRAELSDMADELGVSSDAAVGPAIRNERHFMERLLVADPRSADALAWHACAQLAQGDPGGAVTGFGRASDAAPWFGDPWYLAAAARLVQGNDREAARAAYGALVRPVALSTHTDRYDLGGGAPDEEIMLAAAAIAAGHEDLLDATQRRSPVWELIRTGAPEVWEPPARIDLADRLLSLRDLAGAEREMLNALTLALDDAGRMLAYDHLIAYYDRCGMTRDAELCRRDASLSE